MLMLAFMLMPPPHTWFGVVLACAATMVQHLEELTKEQLIALLEDTQDSLAAALARLESMRLQNRQLKGELSQLRQQVHGHSQPAATGAPKGSFDVSSRAASIVFPQEQNVAGPDWTTCRQGLPCYVSTLEGEAACEVLGETGRTKASRCRPQREGGVGVTLTG